MNSLDALVEARPGLAMSFFVLAPALLTSIASLWLVRIMSPSVSLIISVIAFAASSLLLLVSVLSALNGGLRFYALWGAVFSTLIIATVPVVYLRSWALLGIYIVIEGSVLLLGMLIADRRRKSSHEDES
jgi:hypothetical protein